MRSYRRSFLDFHRSTIVTFSFEFSHRRRIDAESMQNLRMPRYFYYLGFICIAERYREKISIQRVISRSTPAHYDTIYASIYHRARPQPRIFTLINHRSIIPIDSFLRALRWPSQLPRWSAYKPHLRPSARIVRRQITKTDINYSYWLRQITMLRLLIVGCISAPFARVITADWITDSLCFHRADVVADRSGFLRLFPIEAVAKNCNLSLLTQTFQNYRYYTLDVSLPSLHLGIRHRLITEIDKWIPQACLIAFFCCWCRNVRATRNIWRAVTVSWSISCFFENTFVISLRPPLCQVKRVMVFVRDRFAYDVLV